MFMSSSMSMYSHSNILLINNIFLHLSLLYHLSFFISCVITYKF